MAEDKNVKSKIAEREEEILKFWQENKIFEKSLEKPSPKGNFVFFDGPPFATGLPHYGHILPGTIKDVIPRYQTMQGKKVLRRWGWDCHGLPIENLVEKELGLSSKKDIETYGVGKFNKVAKETVMRYADEWRSIIPRVGRWVDMENDYKTMDTTYTESVWWAFKNLYDKGLIYKSFKSMHLCPHCETTLSNFEVNQGYKDIVDISVYLKFKIEGEENTFFLAWTTTPWTLPGNVALAINKEVDYVKAKKDEQFFVLAKDLVNKVLKENYEIINEFKGENLLGKTYVPLFPYYDNEKLENRKNGFKVYHGDFVTTTDGTGIVHIAPAFGEDDMNLGKLENLPFIQHVNVDGTFKNEVTDFAGQKVKPKDDPSNHQDQSHQKADVEVLKYLAKAGTLFEKEKYTHSYPHCWRCDTPLLNYATTSWFVNVTNIKDKMSELNSKICWIPKEIGEGRFGKWIEGARDWAISRSRYWGAPLPVWEDEEGKLVVVGSIDDLKSCIKKSGNKYLLMRHGEAEQNLKDLVNSKLENVFHLTREGEEKVKIASEDLRSKKIDLIICSPFERCLETAKIVAENLGISKENILIDERISEFKAGDEFEGKTWADYYNFFNDFKERFERAPNGGETLIDLNKRAGEFLYDIDSKYENKNILIVAHEGVITALQTISLGVDKKGAIKIKLDESYKSKFAEIKEIDFVPLPHNEDYELDLHKPYIDDVKLVSKNGKEIKRVPEVFDCWFESGSMSFAQNHYPFENKEEMEKLGSSLFPADFIAEGLDQTRGWFYTMLILGTGLFEKSPYDSVVVNGLVLAEDGRKMSKSFKNYPDLMYIVDKYGADSLRFYLMSSPAVKAEDLNFSEKGVDEVSKKLIMKLGNVLSFYEMYKDKTIKPSAESKNILDQWILLKLVDLSENTTKSLDTYKIDSASRPIIDFIEDFSTWYIRRSRDRFKSDDLDDKKDALATTHFVLLNLAKIIAPFVPFFAEDIYLKLKSENDLQSVHLCEWPTFAEDIQNKTEEILSNMEEVRKIVSLALEKRMTAGIKVRQPLNGLKVKSKKLEGKEEYFDLIKDEVNLKNISFDDKLEEEVWLDVEITEDLKKEGNIREIIRAIQDLRKQKKLVPQNEIELIINTDEKGKEFINSNFEEIKKPTNIKKINFEQNDGEELKIDSMVFKIQIV